MNVIEKMKGFRPTTTDPRTRFYLRPVRVLRTTGDVQHADALLSDHDGQVTLDRGGNTILTNKDGERASVLLDFGREINGSLRILTQACQPRQTKLRLRFGESVSEAITPTPGKGATNDHVGRDYEFSISFMGAMDTSETGFRFVYIELVDDNTAVNFKGIEAILIVRDLDYIGSFECSDPLLNNIFDTAAYTVHLNMQEYLWDGIKRDRLVWQGDMHPESVSICAIFGDNEVLPRSMDTSKRIFPLGKWMVFPTYSMWWIMCHHEYYRHNGNLDYLREQHEYMRGLIPLLCEFIGEDGAENSPDKFLDWPTRSDEAASHAGIQGLYAMTMSAAAYLLDELGDNEMASYCREKLELLKKHIPTTNRKQAA
ncbi:MAG: alpha-L-rhamnosidase, partial [Ruminococcaceae bacterium]|nr:alpha-L-rhamnosidase [Oscillospiraceae bacterium]